MKILVIGDQHVVGYGLPAGQVCFVGQFVRQIGQAGHAVTIEVYPQVNLTSSRAMLMQLPLDRYDLIIWQYGQYVPTQPVLTKMDRLAEGARRLLQRLGIGPGTAARQSAISADLTAMLQLLRPQRHKVLVMTPVLLADGGRNWWLEQVRHTLLEKGYEQGFSVFDTSRHVRPRPEYFLTQFSNRLNGVSHELIGRALFDFYQATPTIVAIRSVRKN